MTPLCGSVVEAMGGSPLVALDRLTAALGCDGRILLKLDYLLPGSSKKDRAARAIIEGARAAGTLAPGQTVVELTSGNMGTGLAIVCAVLGHPFVAVMSEGNSPERVRMMAALGAEVVLVPQSPGSRPGEVSGADLDLVEQRAQAITAERGAFRADQFARLDNRAAHEFGTAVELWEQSGGTITAVADFAGSGGTLAGLARGLALHGVRAWAVEPEGAAALAGAPVTRPDHPIQGGGYARPHLDQLDGVALTGHLTVTGDEATGMARRLARTEGVFAGFSTGANVAAAVKLLKDQEKGGAIACIACDSGLKYLSTELWRDGIPSQNR